MAGSADVNPAAGRFRSEGRRRPGGPDAEHDARLLAAVAAGDRGAPVQALFEAHAGAVYGLGLRLLGDASLAEELVQETFVRMWRKAASFDPARGTVRAFVLGLARNLAIDLYRRPSSRPVADHSARDEPVSADQVDRLVTSMAVREALADLTPDHRQVLELAFDRDLRQRDIAERLGIPVGTVKTRSYYALKALRAALEERGLHA